jgi:hypothetical protein
LQIAINAALPPLTMNDAVVRIAVGDVSSYAVSNSVKSKSKRPLLSSKRYTLSIEREHWKHHTYTNTRRHHQQSVSTREAAAGRSLPS